MKRLFVTLFVLGITVMGVNAQDAPKAKEVNKNAPQFKFKDGDTWDFGNNIKEGPQAEHIFEFKNTGKEPLIITNASGSCGCTTPEWPKEPILPGKTGKLTVRYNTQGRVGPFTKEVYIQSNAVVPDGGERYTLHIKGTVLAATDPKPASATTTTNTAPTH
jgi:hypothetical protein